MKPELQAQHVLSTVRATAKMHEFRVARSDFIGLRKDPATLYSLAVGILGDAAGAIAENFGNPSFQTLPTTWTEEESYTENVRFAATFFDAYLEARLDETISTEFSLLCASAYYLSDAVGNATVVARRSTVPAADLGGGLALLAHRLLNDNFSDIDFPIFHAVFARRVLTALRNHFGLLEEDPGELREICKEFRSNIYNIGTDRELFYADVVTAICSRKIGNSARTRLPPASGLPLDRWASALSKPHFPHELWPAQREICDAELLAGRSAVIQMPTSAGKTRATELIIRSAFLSGRTNLAVIVAPFRSLCHEIRSDLARAFSGEEVLMDEVSDSYLMDFQIDQVIAERSILIITPEKLLYVLRREPELTKHIGLVVYDEGHQFEGFTRGPTYELLLASLRMMLSKDAQSILISAVIGNASQIAEWLLGDGTAVVDGKALLPTAKSIAFASWEKQRGWLRYVNPADPDEEEYFVPRIIKELPLKKKSTRERDRLFPDREHPNEISPSVDIGLYLALHLSTNGSVALFCGQKESVSKLCGRVVEIFDREVGMEKPSASSNREQLDRIAHLISENMGVEGNAAGAAKIGVLSHHANVPRGVRVCVEHAMKMGHARIVACTSTLAQGVNFPIKYLIVTATQQGREKIKVRDFHNLMGRAGRAGMHTESSVIFSAPSLFDERNDPDRNWRWRAAKALLNREAAEPSSSSILEIFEDYKQRVGTPIVLSVDTISLDLAFADDAAVRAIVAGVIGKYPNVSASEFRQYVQGRARVVQSIALHLAQHMDFEDEEPIKSAEVLAVNTLGYFLGSELQRKRIIELFQVTGRSLLANADAGYLSLIKKSLLPPADLKKLNDWLVANVGTLSTLSVEEIVPLIASQALPLIAAKSLASVGEPLLLLSLLDAWITGKSFAEIRKIIVDAGKRIGGDRPTAEHAVAICEDGFGYHLAMILSSMSDLVEPINSSLAEQLARLQRRMKNGLETDSANAFYEAGFSDRIVAQALGSAFSAVGNRKDVREVCRVQCSAISTVLARFPAYFVEVARGLTV